MFQALIKVPVEQKFKTDKTVFTTDINKDLLEKDKIKLDKFNVTDDTLWNTRVYEDHKLISIVEDITLKELQDRIKKHELKWVIMGVNDGYIKDGEGNKIINTLIPYDPKAIINFIARKRIYDKDGKLMEEVEPTEIEFGRFQGFPILEAE